MTRRMSRTSAGQSIVEAALVLPMFLACMLFLFDAGRLVFVQNSLSSIAREGARVGQLSVSSVSSSYAWSSRYQAIRSAALAQWVGMGDVRITSASVYGQSGTCPSPLPADTTKSGTCFYPSGYSGSGELVYVQVRVEVPLITPVLSAFVGNPCTDQPSQRCVTLTAISTLVTQ